MRAIDPRFLGYAAALRGLLAAEAVLALVHAVCVAAIAWLIAATVAHAIAGTPPSEIGVLLVWLTGFVVVRAGVAWARDVLAARAAASVKGQLRSRLTDAIGRLGPAWTARRNSASLATICGPGLDALDGYLQAYLPQVVLTAVATPAIVVALFAQDVLTGVIVMVTLPLIPLFMILIGLATRSVQRKHWSALNALSVAFLDVVEGLATLKIFGRERHQYTRIRSATNDYRMQTMRVLRVSFLNGFVLEFIASLSVAVVAVSVGVRLIDGSLPLATGLAVLVLTPEAYLPIRQMGVQYHAATEGVSVAEEAFAILDDARSLATSEAVPAGSLLPARGSGARFLGSGPGEAPRGTRTPSSGERRGSKEASLIVDRLDVDYDGRSALHEFSEAFAPGAVTTITGASGAGKSTLFAALLGFVPYRGRIELDGLDLSALTPDGRLALIAWSGQRPGLIRGTVAGNVTLGDADPADRLVPEALAQASADEIDPATELGVAGSGLSGGQAQRVAIARAFYRASRMDTPLLLVDEPTSALDPRHEELVVTGLAEHARQGRIVLVVSHRPALVAACDREVRIGTGLPAFREATGVSRS